MIPSKPMLALLIMSVPMLASAGGQSPATAPAAQMVRPGPLAPVDLLAIRQVGRAVLGVRQGASSDPVQEAMRQEVKALGTELDQALKAAFSTPPTLTIGRRSARLHGSAPNAEVFQAAALPVMTAGPDGKPIAAPSAPTVPLLPAAKPATVLAPMLAEKPPSPAAGNVFAGVRTRLEGVYQHAEQLAPAVHPDAQGEHSALLIARATGLAEEVRAAIDTGRLSPEDAARLGQLRDRLKPRTLAGLIAQQQAAAHAAVEPVSQPAPSITTLIRHR